MSKVSIIVTAYNAERYIGVCVKAILVITEVFVLGATLAEESVLLLAQMFPGVEPMMRSLPRGLGGGQ